QWQMVRDNRRGVLVSRRQAERWKLKVGDTFTVITPPVQKKTDGSNNWTFQVLAITPDINYIMQGYMFGNYDYFDKGRLLADQGKTGVFRVKLSDPSRTAAIAEEIDNKFANSPTP